MEDAILKHKRLLGIGRNLDFLLGMRQTVQNHCPLCQFDLATRFEEGRQLVLLLTYDLVISDVLSATGLAMTDLLTARNLPVVAVMDPGTSHEVLGHFPELKIRSTINKQDPDGFVPVIERALKSETSNAWNRAWKAIRDVPHFIISSLASTGPERSVHVEKSILY
ncbi:MAG: hypothetical protein JRJ85_04090 [Deltaproteobacteria bacterium]|nr:hypothetical protein [Deltaproteobacteria bacterium]